MALLSRPLRHTLAVALALAAAPAFAQGDSPYSDTVFIGDSLTDAGYFRPVLLQVVGPSGALIGKFTTNPGLVWSEYLADYYGTDASPNGNGQSGDNYAAGGARVGVDVTNALGFIPSLATQTSNYLAANGGRADPNALYTVWGGANDVFAVVSDPSQAQAIIGGAVTAQISIVGTLQAAGAQYVLVPNLPDIGVTPSFRAGGAAAMGQGTALATAYNDALFGGLASNGLRVIPVDTFHFLQEVVADPGQYGFANVTTAGCGMQPAPAGDSSLFCNPGSYVDPSVQTSYLFADGVHPSAAAQEAISQLALGMLEGPRQIAVLPHSAATTGRARADIVGSHVSGAPESDGMRWWTNLRGDFQRYGSGDDYDGVIPALAGGVDWSSGNLVFGGFAGYGRGRIDFGHNTGKFEQSDATLGAFIGWYGEGGGWVNGQVSYSKLDFDVDRRLRLGQAVRTHSGSADGDNVTAAINAGWNFGSGALQHGPVLGVVSQRIKVDGYAESDPGQSSSLAFADQDFDSLIGSIGWQASYAINDHLVPYARFTYDHEFEDGNDQVFARAQSIPGSLEYAVPGLEYDRNYTTVVIGARTRLLGLDANVGATATVQQGGGNNATVFATLGSSF
ncbi:autotransporter domain-containing protein [Luteimonas lutimaris]|uniref:Autotransporter domain-containing protein n=1 Tax=Luteimonas lutimaris TaxID=698645 RepID=A0ABP7N0K2_9GAMM